MVAENREVAVFRFDVGEGGLQPVEFVGLIDEIAGENREVVFLLADVIEDGFEILTRDDAHEVNIADMKDAEAVEFFGEVKVIESFAVEFALRGFIPKKSGSASLTAGSLVLELF